MKELVIGDRVMVFNDPITEKDPEGEAILVRKEREDGFNRLALWLVHFVNDPDNGIYLRWIRFRKEG